MSFTFEPLQLTTLTDPGESWEIDFVLSGPRGTRREVKGLQPRPLRWTSVDLLTRFAPQEASAPVMAHNRSPVVLPDLKGAGDFDCLLGVVVQRVGSVMRTNLSFGAHGLEFRDSFTGQNPDQIFFPPGSLQVHFSRETGLVLPSSPATVLPDPTPRVSSTCCAWSHKLHLYDASGLLEEGLIHYDRHGWPAASRWGSDWYELVYSRPTL